MITYLYRGSEYVSIDDTSSDDSVIDIVKYNKRLRKRVRELEKENQILKDKLEIIETNEKKYYELIRNWLEISKRSLKLNYRRNVEISPIKIPPPTMQID